MTTNQRKTNVDEQTTKVKQSLLPVYFRGENHEEIWVKLTVSHVLHIETKIKTSPKNHEIFM